TFPPPQPHRSRWSWAPAGAPAERRTVLPAPPGRRDRHRRAAPAAGQAHPGPAVRAAGHRQDRLPCTVRVLFEVVLLGRGGRVAGEWDLFWVGDGYAGTSTDQSGLGGWADLDDRERRLGFQ